MNKYLVVTISIVVIAFVLLRIVFPVRHTATGYVVHWYPLSEHAVCETRPCAVDRSRTFLEVVALAGLGSAIVIRSSRKRR